MRWTADRKSFDRLVLENLPALQRFAIRLTGNVDEAEDLVQETLLRATRAWETYRGHAQFRTWLFQIVVNVFRDRLRKRPPPGALPDGLVDAGGVAPAAGAETDERGRLIAKAVSALPPRQREVIVLHTYEQLTIAEVAQALGITEVNVRAQLTYARKRLKELLAPYLDSMT
jgi:RNA polymerase sigma-70 factor (ECF subfamily)